MAPERIKEEKEIGEEGDDDGEDEVEQDAADDAEGEAVGRDGRERAEIVDEEAGEDDGGKHGEQDDGLGVEVGGVLHAGGDAVVEAQDPDAGAERGEEAAAGEIEMGVETEGGEEVFVGAEVVAGGEGSVAGVGVAEGVVGEVGEKAGDGFAALLPAALMAVGLGEEIEGGGVVGVESEDAVAGLLGFLPLAKLGVGVGEGVEGSDAVWVDGEAGVGRFFSGAILQEANAEPALAAVEVGDMRGKADGAVDGVDGFVAIRGYFIPAAGEFSVGVGRVGIGG